MSANILSVLYLIVLFGGVSGITNNNGRYEDINIIIQDSVAENETLLSRIQEIFTEASQLLFMATKQQVYFGKINIILPKNWTFKSEYTVMPARSEFNTYITVEDGRIKRPHSKPKKRKCGKQMRYIYLPTGFLLTEGKTEWGEHANVIVHEWGHYRWGLYDEYVTNKEGRFYMKDGVWKPSRCSESITGTAGRGSDCSKQTKCDLSNTEQTLHQNCKFCPDETQTNENLASIMAYNWIEAVTMFCDNPDDPTVPVQQRHNRQATNKHNKKCKYRSAWEVMRDHEDFLNAPLPNTTVTTPEFEILQENDCSRVFVLDVSGSMRVGTRISDLYKGSRLLIETMLEDNSWLGIVTFSSSAQVVKSLTQITSTSVRADLVNALPMSPGGSTCIGCGIEAALSMLTAGSSMVVISDGGNNEGNLDASVQMAIDANVIIHTLAVSQAADSRLQAMASATGGFFKAYLESELTLSSAFMSLLECGVTSYASGSTTLLSETLGTTQSTEASFTFDIDDSIGKSTTVSIILGTSTNVLLEVLDPNGDSYTELADGDSIILVLPDTIPTGQFHVSAKTSSLSTFEYYVTSLPTDLEPIRVILLIDPTTLDFLSTGELPVIYADVVKGRAPILNANVIAVVDNGVATCNVTLLDNGADPDDALNDGTYAGVIPSTCLYNGRIAIKVYVRGEGGTSQVLNDFSGAGSLDSGDETNSTDTLETSFQRTAVADEIQVTNVVSQDIVAPGQITDVEIVDILTEHTQYGESRNFTITWTATGDDVNIGQATEYELRISDNQTVLLDSFASADLLDVVNSNFTPKAAGETEAIRIQVDAEESYVSTAYFAVRAKDDADNVGAVSNIVSIIVANGYRIKVEADVVVVYSNTDDSVDETEVEVQKEKNLIGLAVGLSSATAIIVIAIFAVTCCVKKFKAKEVVEDSNFNSRTSITTVTTIDKPLKDFLKTIDSRQTVAKRAFHPSQLPTIQEREQVWTSHFSNRPISASSVISYGRKKPFDIVSQGECSIQMLVENNEDFSEQMEGYLDDDLSGRFSPLNSYTGDGEDMAGELSPGLNSPDIPQDMPQPFATLNGEPGAIEEYDPSTTESVEKGEDTHERKNKNAKKEMVKGVHRFDQFEERPVTNVSLSSELHIVDNDEMSREIRKCYEEIC